LEPPAPNITDYLDPLIAPEAQSDCWRIILKLLSNLGNGSTPVLALHNVRDQASLCDVLPPIASQEGFSFEKTFCENAPRIRLPGTFEQWLGTLDAHHRKEVRRKLNKALAKGNADLQICPVDQIAATLDRFIVLMQRRGGQKAQDVRRVLGPILRLAAPALIRQGRIRISTLLIHAHPAASLLDMPTPDGPMLYNTGFDPSLGQWSPGVVAIVLSIRAAIASGASVYDLLRGDEPYKYRLGAVNCPLWRITLRRR
jgi:CelD/BcsL family acetyltransferase involved in cellulose biosynthesis